MVRVSRSSFDGVLMWSTEMVPVVSARRLWRGQ
jgi:hypothetical protein